MKEFKVGVLINLFANALRFSRLGFSVLAFHYYGADKFGTYVIIWAVTEVLLQFGRVGLAQGLLFELSHFKSSGQEASLYAKITSSLKIIVGVSTLTTLLLIGYAQFYVDVPETRTGLYIIAPCLIPYGIAVLLLHATMGLKEMKYNALIRSGGEPIVLLVLSLVFLITPFKKNGLVFAQAGALLTTSALSLWAYGKCFSWRKTFQAWNSRFPVKNIIRYSFPMYAVSTLDTVLYRMDIYLLSYLLGTGTQEQKKLIGIYGFARQIARVLARTKNSFSPIFVSMTSEALLNQDRKNLWSQVRYALEKLTLLNMALSFFLIVLAPQIMALAGKNAALIQPIVVYNLIMGQAVFSTGSLFVYLLISLKRTLGLMCLFFCMGIFLGLAGLWIVPQFKVLGVSTLMFITYGGIGLGAFFLVPSQFWHEFLSVSLLKIILTGSGITLLVLELQKQIPSTWPTLLSQIILAFLGFGLFLSLNVLKKK